MKLNNRLLLVGGVVALLLVVGFVFGWQRRGSGPEVVVYKTPTCGCCTKWVDHLREAGFTVETHDLNDLSTIKANYGVQRALSSCHTAVVEGYVVEGHVPAAQVKQLLEERPEGVAGIAVPGMPIGSPGMEGPNPQPYDVLAFDRVGRTRVFAHVAAR